MDLRIKDKKAIVMGGSSGIGKAVARALIAEGARVAICARNEDRLKKAAEELGASLAIPCDLNLPGTAKNVVQAVSEKFGTVDILIINTGGPAKGDFQEIPSEQWQVGFQGLWMSTVDAIQAALPRMKKQRWGRILLVTSVAAKESMPHLTISNGLRAGLLGLTKSVSNEIAAHGITINALLPGYTRTERLLELGIQEEQISAQIPSRRLGEPEEFAALATFLASEQASYVTGQAIACDGGYMKGF